MDVNFSNGILRESMMSLPHRVFSPGKADSFARSFSNGLPHFVSSELKEVMGRRVVDTVVVVFESWLAYQVYVIRELSGIGVCSRDADRIMGWIMN